MDDEDSFDIINITNQRKDEILSTTAYGNEQLEFLDLLQQSANTLYNDLSNDVINSSNQNQALMFLAREISTIKGELAKDLFTSEIITYLYNAFIASSPNDAQLPFISYLIYYVLSELNETDIFLTQEFIEKLFTLNQNTTEEVRNNLEHIFAFLNYQFKFNDICSPEMAFNLIKGITNPIIQACCYSNLNKRDHKFQADELLSLIDFGFAILSNSDDDKTCDTILTGLAINLSELENISPSRGHEAIIILNQSNTINKILDLLQTKTASFNSAAVIYFLMRFGYKTPEFINELLRIIQDSLEQVEKCEFLESLLKLYSKILKFKEIPLKREHFEMIQDIYAESPLKLKDQVLNILQTFIERDGKGYNLSFSNDFITELLDNAMFCQDNNAKYPLDLLSSLFLVNHPSIRDLRDTDQFDSLYNRVYEIKDSNYYGELNKSADKCLIALDTFLDSVRSYNMDLSD